jgi:pyruvate dehydrogenase E2 component (dihydrolipoamide acetyltransferase)
MAIKILMPALSPTMKDGNLAKWLKKEGDTVESGEVMAEIETDKAIMEVEAVDEGTIAKIIVEEGTKNIKVNDIIAILAEEGEDLKDAVKSIDIAPKAEEEKATAKNNVSPSKEEKNVLSAVEKNESRIFASPLAKRIAAQKNINLGSINGSGPHGRIVKSDVENFTGMQSFAQVISREDAEIPVSNIRKVIAERLIESKQQIPHFYLEIECVVNKLLDFRKEINLSAKNDKDGKPEYKVSINDLIIKATSLALLKHPKVNSSWAGDKIIQYGNVDISVAVAIDDGLMTPIVKNTNQKNILQISREVKDLAKRARAQKLKPEEYQGGSFSISNLGMYSITSFYAIINPPQSCILSIGTTKKVPMYDEYDELKMQNVMIVTLSCDHRVVDGVTAAMFLTTFKEFIENPALMICY